MSTHTFVLACTLFALTLLTSPLLAVAYYKAKKAYYNRRYDQLVEPGDEDVEPD